MQANLGPKLADVEYRDVSGVSADDAVFSDVQGAGGYRLLSRDQPIISVPGIPDLWNSTARVAKVPTDNTILGLSECRDTTGAILLPHDISTMEPIFHALSSPAVLDSVSLICNRNTLRKLYRQGFRIDAELVGNAVILHRFETADLRLFIQPKKISAQSYHLAATTRISVNSPDDVGGCNRMVTYRFVGMKLLVRFDVDACLELPASISDQNKPVDVAIPAADERAWVDSGGAAMPRLIEVVPSGYHHPSHSTLLEIKSRHIRKRVDLADIYGQLVFSQNPRCYIARHNRHDYSVAPVEKYRLDGVEFAQVSKKQAPIIKRVAGVLQQIVELTRTYGEVGFVVIDGKMAVYKRDGGVPPLSNGAREMILRAAAVAHA